MKNRIISAFLVLMLCFSIAVCASAAPDNGFVIDEVGYLADAEMSTLNTLAGNIYDTCGVGLFFVYTTAENLDAYDVTTLVGGMEDYFVMLENETSWYTYAGGKGQQLNAEALRDAYDAEDTYVEGVDAVLSNAAESFDTSTGAPDAEEYLIYDDADLLTDMEERELTQKLLNVSHAYNAQILIATVSSMDGSDVDRYVEYLYDAMGFGYGESHDGVLLLVCMDPREYRILSNGIPGDAIDSNEIEKIGDAIVSDLTDGYYYAAFDEFADQCDYYINGHLNGFPFNFGKSLMIALIIGILAGAIVAFALKGQLKSVRKQNQANVYVKSGSMQITERSDMFLYRNVTRTKKESSKSSGSGGGSRNVGGGSF